jgi:membrane-associated protease RseP (regulator of RpoE activity)
LTQALVRHVGLFVATGASMVVTYALMDAEVHAADIPRWLITQLISGFSARAAWGHGAIFAAALLLILLSHELGHYFAARLHKVDASLPFFIPMPLLSPFGTMGAVIRMRSKIESRRALLDIGASGPLAGLVFAIPLYVWGVRHSPVILESANLGGTFGESLLTRGLDAMFGPHLADGTVLVASPVLFAAWAGLFVTMLNLLPIGQLDGGHVAYALFGTKQDRAALVIHRSLLAFFFVSLGSYLVRDFAAGVGFHHLGARVNDSLFWLVWFEILGVLGTITKNAATPDRGRDSDPDLDGDTVGVRTRVIAVIALSVLASEGREHNQPGLWAAWFVGLAVLLAMEVRGGTLRPHTMFDHPNVKSEGLGPVRAAVALISLAFFALLFMPTPISL